MLALERARRLVQADGMSVTPGLSVGRPPQLFTTFALQAEFQFLPPEKAPYSSQPLPRS
jgi:hypothetical protein